MEKSGNVNMDGADGSNRSKKTAISTTSTRL